jgi:TPR repeat protein
MKKTNKYYLTSFASIPFRGAMRFFISLFFVLLIKSTFGQVDSIISKRDPKIIEIIKESVKYLNGTGGIKKNVDLAFTKIQQGANLGDDMCQLMLGNLYENGIGTKQNYGLAKKWYTKSSEKGNTSAMLALGCLYKSGKMEGIDFKNAVKWFKMGADLGNSSCEYATGYMYAKGFGVSQDYCIAVGYYKKSAAKKNTGGTHALAYCYEHGYGTEKNLAEAIKLYEYAASKGYGQSKVWLDNYKKGGPKSATILPADFAVAKNGFSPVYAEEKTIQIQGNFEGKLILYDWAGNIVDEQYDVKLIYNHGQQIKFLINGLEATSDYKEAGNGFTFDKLCFNRPNPLGGESKWSINRIYFRQEQIGDILYLIGDAGLFSEEINEPGPHAYLMLKTNVINVEKPVVVEPVKPEVITTINYELAKDNATPQKTPIEPKKQLAVIKEVPSLKAYPNPFNQEINIEVALQESSELSLYILSSTGQVVKMVKNKYLMQPGKQTFTVDGIYKTGIYFVVLQTGDYRQTLSIIKN